MSQKHVERIIGRLVTDEAFRKWYAKSPMEAMQAMIDYGVELTPSEIKALSSIDISAAENFSKVIDPTLQKVC